MNSKKVNVLYLARWYPHRYDSMFGLFVHRHAMAAGKYCNIGTVYTHVDIEKDISGYELDYQTEDGVKVIRVYYNQATNPLAKAYRFWKANRLGIMRMKQEMGAIDIIHVHILTRLGLVALYYKLTKGIPYLISEHWSRYLNITNGYNGIFRKWLTRIVVSKAKVVTVVTKNMMDAMKSHHLKNGNYRLLANVVDEPFLTVSKVGKSAKRKKLLHISCFEDVSKNVSGIVNVLGKMKNRDDYEFHFIGHGMDFDKTIKLAYDLKLDKTKVFFHGLMDSSEIANHMADADLLVMFSNYENFPVVINEAFCMGVPVLATAVGGIPEKVNNSNGILIEPQDEQALYHKLTAFLDDKYHFDTQKLKVRSRKEFSAETIGKELYTIYLNIKNKK